MTAGRTSGSDVPRPLVHALVVAGGRLPSRTELDAAWPGWDDEVGLVVAADGGVTLAEQLGLAVDLWVGDGDSVEGDALERLRAAGVPIELASVDKDESDTELAVLAALRRGASDVTVVGGLGGLRFDHALANVALLGHPALAGRSIRLVDPGARLSLLDAPGPDGAAVRRELPGRVGDVVSLLPFGGDAEGVTTEGLRYPLRDEPLRAGPARGLSNVRTAADAAVSVRSGRLLVVESPATLPG